MRVKRFFAADMRSAMKLVRDEMGADASIIANRRVAGGIELTAALDYEAPRLTPPTPGLDTELKKTQERILSARASLQAGETPAAAAPAADSLDVMRAEIAGLRDLLESQLGSLAWGKVNQQQPRQASLWRRLVHLGLPADLCRSLLSKVDEAGSLGEALGLAIEQRLPVAYMADGQRIPDDLARGVGHQLVSRAVGLIGNEVAEDQTMADVFAGILHAQRAS